MAIKQWVSVLVMSAAAWAAEPVYVGKWKIAGAVVAPWWSNTKQAPDAAESKTLVGQTIVISAKTMTGPPEVACAAPKFKLKSVPAEGLFQGMFDEMQRKDKKRTANEIAGSVGFRGKEWKTLETGCEWDVELHFADGNTAAFALNNYIYTMKRE